MPRHKTGGAVIRRIQKGKKTVKVWYARIQFFDDAGKRKQIERKPAYNSESSAREKARELLAEFDTNHKAFDAPTMTFDDLAAYYQVTYLVDPEYRDGRKISGLRSKYDFEHRLKALKDFFGKKKLRSLTHGDLQRYKTQRLKTPVIAGRNTRGTKEEGKPKTRPRSIATVHRELSFMRRILNVAVANGWILRNPFEQGESLIKPGDEKPRERIISREEEARLLAFCTDERAHLRAIIICALDTGMRRGEMFSLKWSDVDFETGLITIRAFNTKTMRERQVAMTDRLRSELLRLNVHQEDNLVFGIKTSAKSAFNWAKKKAGLSDLRFHDLRHTHATRLVGAQMPLPEVGRVLGHTQPSTTFRYVNINEETAKRAADLLNSFNNATNNKTNRKKKSAAVRREASKAGDVQH
jgi:integrase